jgi:hypothetical protein
MACVPGVPAQVNFFSGVFMAAVMPSLATPPAAQRLLLSGNEAVARGVWEAGTRVAAAYPGTPATEILETLSRFPDLHAEWSVNEKVSMEVALGASMTGARAFCAMKHVGLNVASDCLMTMTITGAYGGLVIAVADDVGMSSSQNEQDSRFWGRFAHIPVLEPADSQEAYEMAKQAFVLSETHETPVLLRLTTRICHVKGLVTVGEREAHEPAGFVKNPQRWVMVPAHAKVRIPSPVPARRDAARSRRNHAAQRAGSRQRPQRRLRHLGPGLHACQGSLPRRAGAEAGPLLPLAAEEAARTRRPVRQAGGGRGNRKDPRNRTQGRRHRLPRQGHPAQPGRTLAAGADARHRPPAGQAGAAAGPLPPRRPSSSRGRRRCAPPARTWACTTRCRRSRT